MKTKEQIRNESKNRMRKIREEQKLKLEDYDTLCVHVECPIHPCSSHLIQQNTKPTEYMLCVLDNRKWIMDSDKIIRKKL